MSDLRRFWNGRPEDFSLEELDCFYKTLPEDSATLLALSDYAVPLSTLVLSEIRDRILSLHLSFGKKKLKKSDKMLESFKKKQHIINSKKDEKYAANIEERLRKESRLKKSLNS